MALDKHLRQCHLHCDSMGQFQRSKENELLKASKVTLNDLCRLFPSPCFSEHQTEHVFQDEKA